MAFTTEFTQAQVAAITRAIGLGVLEVEHNGKRTKYQSLTQMLAIRDRMKSELAAAASSGSALAQIPFMTRRTIFVRD